MSFQLSAFSDQQDRKTRICQGYSFQGRFLPGVALDRHSRASGNPADRGENRRPGTGCPPPRARRRRPGADKRRAATPLQVPPDRKTYPCEQGYRGLRLEPIVFLIEMWMARAVHASTSSARHWPLCLGSKRRSPDEALRPFDCAQGRLRSGQAPRNLGMRDRDARQRQRGVG